MLIEIRRWDNNEIIVCGEYDSVKDCIEKNKNKSFYRANLSGSNLSGSNLSGSDLRNSNLSGSNLRNSNLIGSDLRNSNLSGSNLSGSNLSGSNLSGSDLPSPTMVLLASWGVVSDQLCLDLMRWDAFNHPNPEAFLYWAKRDSCPYKSTKIQRSAMFSEKRELIKEDFLDIPVKSAYELMQALIKEKCKQL